MSPLWKEPIPFEVGMFHEGPVSSPSSLPPNPGTLPAPTQCTASPGTQCELLCRGTLWHQVLAWPRKRTGTLTTLSQVLWKTRSSISWDFHSDFSLLKPPVESLSHLWKTFSKKLPFSAAQICCTSSWSSANRHLLCCAYGNVNISNIPKNLICFSFYHRFRDQ